MSDEIDPILGIFFEECTEQLAELERSLDLLSSGNCDQDTINSVFRAVHSIKGGAASFGLDNLVRFSHVFESALDCLRSGGVEPSTSVVQSFLRATDTLNDLVNEAKGEQRVDPGRVHSCIEELEAIISTDKRESFAESSDSADHFSPVPVDFTPVPFDFDAFDDELVENVSCWIVSFTPTMSLYANGNDARNLLRELVDLGEGRSQVEVDLSKLPDLDNLDPDESYLTWKVEIPGAVSEDSIRSVFDWVEGACSFSLMRDEDRETVAGLSVTAENGDDAPVESVEEAIFSDNGEARTVGEIEPENADNRKTKSPASPPVASIRVNLDRVDKLADLIGELVIGVASVRSICDERSEHVSRDLLEGVETVETLVRDIQDGVMAVRAQPVKTVFQRMNRVVREACNLASKEVRLITRGEDTEVDRTLFERLTDPLTHMLRNAVDHGIEAPEKREALGKSPYGTITLSAAHRSGRIMITISDDGGGITRERVVRIAKEKGIIAEDAVLTDDEIDNLIFAPGFSTAEKISDLSGRGVGMDVVKQAIQDLGGRITIESTPGKGSVFALSLPLTLAVLEGMAVMVNGNTMIVPVASVVETMIFDPDSVFQMTHGVNALSVRGVYVPVMYASECLGEPRKEPLSENSVVLIVENEAQARAALIVDRISDQMQVIIKSIERNYRQIPCVSAATILGDGTVALILDVSAIIADKISRIPGRSQEKS